MTAPDTKEVDYKGGSSNFRALPSSLYSLLQSNRLPQAMSEMVPCIIESSAAIIKPSVLLKSLLSRGGPSGKVEKMRATKRRRMRMIEVIMKLGEELIIYSEEKRRVIVALRKKGHMDTWNFKSQNWYKFYLKMWNTTLAMGSFRWLLLIQIQI